MNVPQLINEFHCHPAEYNVITDRTLYYLIQRSHDYSNLFYISPPIGNRGRLNPNTPDTDLEPFPSAPSDPLTYNPLGLWCAMCVMGDQDGDEQDRPRQKEVRKASARFLVFWTCRWMTVVISCPDCPD